MVDDLDALEAQLLVLGRQELSLQQQLSALHSQGRSAAQRGDQNTADAAWDLYEDVRVNLLVVSRSVASNLFSTPAAVGGAEPSRCPCHA